MWRVSVEPQKAHNDAITESVESSMAEAIFDAKRRAVLALLGFDPETPNATGGDAGDHGISGLFLHLIGLPDEAVLDILAIVMGETLEAGSNMIEVLGVHLGVDMASFWQADDALLDLIRDREVLNRIVADVAGDTAAKGNVGEAAKVQRQIVRDCLAGRNGRGPTEGWVPRWMAFPPSAYTARGGVGSVTRWNDVAELIEPKSASTSPDIASVTLH